MSTQGGDGGSRRLKQSVNVVSSRVGEAGVLVHLLSNRIFEVNETGVRVWELLGEGRSLDEIEERLQVEFSENRERLRSDIQALVDALAREGLVE